MRFLDTNILLYAISSDPSERRKTEIAIEILGSPIEQLGLSVQVLQEFYVQATRPSRAGGLPQLLAGEYVDHWQAFRVQENTLEIFRAAIACCRRFRISYWDAAIIEAARAMKCDAVLSEDLSDSESYGGVRVVNPFLEHAPKSRPRRRAGSSQ